MSELEAFAKSIVKAAAKKLSPVSFIGGQVRKMEREDVDKLATAYLLAQVRTRKRAEVLEVERDSTMIRDALAKKERYKKHGPQGEGLETWEEWASRAENHEAAAVVRNQREEDEREREERDRARTADIARMIDYWKEAVIVEWTDNLLRSKFALGDGTETTWGDATREQHLYRINMHKAHAAAGIEGAARHQQAIDELDATGCLTLSEAVSVTA